ncbi:hypothetical protein [Amycolatopsis sp. H20-H5]|uniref:hypothetical protein n=1 Tax=Amycolatopsis sp. H20-H5 TaxID=3046309 RepID=UPI002DB73736|nr:hypothetical protein [Amycolatopsis sp. H20-H5]MEC3974240.1 hypothetical protein [Amycolatopsis sp. H20-H5]
MPEAHPLLEDSKTAPLSCLKVTFDVRFQHFSLRGPDRVHPDESAKTREGILNRVQGQLRCRTGTTTDRVVLRVETFEEAPVLAAADYVDVVEVSYDSSGGELRVFTWPDTIIGDLPISLEAETSYRVRYHRSKPALETDETGRKVTEKGLLQLWLAPHAVPRELKVTSSNGLFWHSRYAFTQALRNLGP